jgi:1-acyl-sn-glycerol-3-phosphate acyltransferase
MKWLSFFVFGLGAVVIIILILPVMRIFIHPRRKYKKYAHRLVSASHNGFVIFMHIIGLVDRVVESKEAFRNFKSKIIAVNHPSILDVVLMFSLVPNSDCVVAGYLSRTIVSGIVRQLYILNSRDFDDILNACKETLEHGENLLVFPEGTRTLRGKKKIARKGTARIALATGYSIVPMYIGGNDKFGLGKKDPWVGVHTREKYVYKISIGEEIKPQKFMNMPRPAAVRALTREIAAAIFPEGQ